MEAVLAVRDRFVALKVWVRVATRRVFIDVK
jgi:hypothetical protein